MDRNFFYITAPSKQLSQKHVENEFVVISYRFPKQFFNATHSLEATHTFLVTPCPNFPGSGPAVASKRHLGSVIFHITASQDADRAVRAPLRSAIFNWRMLRSPARNNLQEKAVLRALLVAVTENHAKQLLLLSPGLRRTPMRCGGLFPIVAPSSRGALTHDQLRDLIYRGWVCVSARERSEKCGKDARRREWGVSWTKSGPK